MKLFGYLLYRFSFTSADMDELARSEVAEAESGGFGHPAVVGLSDPCWLFCDDFWCLVVVFSC